MGEEGAAREGIGGAAPVLLQVGSRGGRSLSTRRFSAMRVARVTYCEAADRWTGMPGDLARRLHAELRAREPAFLRLGLDERIAYLGLLGAAALLRAGFATRVLTFPLDWTCDPVEEYAGIAQDLPQYGGLAFATIPDLAHERRRTPAVHAARSHMDGPVICVSDAQAAESFVDAVDEIARSEHSPDRCVEEILISWMLQDRVRTFRQGCLINAENLPCWRHATREQVAGAFVQSEMPMNPFVFNRHELRPTRFLWQTPEFAGASVENLHLRDRIRSAFVEKSRIEDQGRGSADPISGAEQFMLRRYLEQARANAGPGWREDFVAWMLGGGDAGPGASRIEAEIYRHRPDLQAAFPGDSRSTARRLRRWFAECGLSELGLSLIARQDLAGGAGPENERRTVSCDVHVVGYMDGVLGLGIGAQNHRDALAQAGVSIASTAIDLPGPRGAQPPRRSIKCRVSLLVINGDYTHVVSAMLDRNSLGNSHRIGVWAWELSRVPRRMLRGLPHVDELWVPSGFIRDAFRPHTRKPITVVPYPVAANYGEAPGFDGLLPREPYFFFAFDYNSTIERKNPLGLIEAFEAAFPGESGPHLVIKTLNAGAHAERHERLLDRALRRRDIHLVDAIWPRAQMHRALRDCLGVVSLHRAEGFGLLLAEAMAHGKPTIATGYSGNLEFQHPGNALLVRHRMTGVSAGCEQYDAGETWAEPDLDDAARAMRAVSNGGPDVERLARAAAQTVRERLAPQVIGNQMKGLLQKHLQPAGGTAAVLRQWRQWRGQ